MVAINLISFDQLSANEAAKVERRRLKMIEYAKAYRESNYQKHRAAVKRWQINNPERRKETALAYRLRNKNRIAEYARLNKMKTAYGIGQEDYQRMLAEQGGNCAICLGGPHGKGRWGRYLHVDHCHVTGKVRGLLCGNCNSALGFLKEDSRALQRMINYINNKGHLSC